MTNTHALALPAAGLPLTAAASAYVAASKAASTQRRYASALDGFAIWCADHGLQALPAAPATVIEYITDLAGRGKATNTISVHLAAIGWAHRGAAALHPGQAIADPTSNELVRSAWSGITHSDTRQPKRAKALTLTTLSRLLDASPTTYERRGGQTTIEPSLAGARDRALLLLLFATAMRRSEACALTVDDVEDHDRGRSITIRRSKTDQAGHGRIAVLPRGAHPDTCPVRALDAWLRDAAITDGPLFRKVTSGNHPTDAALNPNSMNGILDRAFRRAGLDPTGYTAHSTRAGHVTHAYRQGARVERIMQQTGHKQSGTVMKYLRFDSAWEDGNSAEQLGL